MSENKTSGATKQTRIWIKTDKDVQFTTAITQYAIDTETCSDFLPGDEVFVWSLVMLADEQVNYDVYFFDSATANTADLDTDATLGVVHMDIVTNGQQISATGMYRMENRLDVPLHIKNSKKGDNNLYVGISPQSAGKTAGSTGEVVLKFSVQKVGGQ